MKTNFMHGAVLASLISLVACASHGGDASNPPKGGVDRRYSKTPDEVARAASETLQELGINVQADTHDALGGQVQGERGTADKQDVSIWYKSVDARNTQVSVMVGKGDKQLAQLIQDRLAQKLGAAGAAAVMSVGAISELTVEQPLAPCISAAEAALRELRMNVTRREVHDTWAEVESRESDAIPVQVKIERTEKDKTRVVFSAGTARSQDTQQLADRVRAEFEKKIGQTSAK